MERVVASPLFRNSKRYPAFLRYVVDQAVLGNAEQLKERTLGVEVFGRDPEYDTNADHIVRSTAGDVRRRLAQYYAEPGHDQELRIDLLPGSYLPTFRQGSAVEDESRSVARPVRSHSSLLFLGATAIAVAVIVFLARDHRRTSALDLFWDPVVQAESSAVLCISSGASVNSAPQPAPGNFTLNEAHTKYLESVPLSDATVLTRVSGELGRLHKDFHVLFAPEARLADLRQGPIVLIGAFDNAWTIRLTGPLRYTFAFEGSSQSSIKDRGRTIATVDWNAPYLSLKEDHALISRVFDPTTGQPVIVAAGMTRFGTLAAGEFLTREDQMAELARTAPPDWAKRNVQVVLAAPVIQGSSGRPKIVATYFW